MRFRMIGFVHVKAHGVTFLVPVLSLPNARHPQMATPFLFELSLIRRDCPGCPCIVFDLEYGNRLRSPLWVRMTQRCSGLDSFRLLPSPSCSSPPTKRDHAS